MEKRRLRGEMIEVDKIVPGVENVERETFLSLSLSLSLCLKILEPKGVIP